MSGVHEQNLAQLVEETIRTLFDKGIPLADLAPLIKLHDVVRQSAAPSAPAVAPAVAPAAPAAPALVQPAAELAAITDLTTVAPAPAPNSGPYDRDGRRGEVKASEDLMARASAIIDVLIQSGQSPEHSAQTITRQLLGVGVQLPECGGDARAWKRLLNWRNTLIHYTRSGPGWDAYCSFKEQLAGIPTEQRLRLVVDEHLWEKRKPEFVSQESA